MNVADRIAEWLNEKKIHTAFGIIGGGNCALFEAIAKKNKTQIVCVHHEQAAAMSSAYFNRIAGHLKSVVLVTTGAGSSNAITGVLAAQMDGIPLLIISGNEDSKHMDAKTRILGVQGYRSDLVARHMCKYAEQYDDTYPITNYLDGAYQSAVTPRQGACWLDVPKDLAQCQL